MSGLPVNTRSQADEYRKQYMAYLALEAQNDAFNLMANQVYKQTGQPSRPPDTRTITEKFADIEEVKVRLLNELLAITDGQNALETISNLNSDEIAFALQMIEMITKDLKPRFSRGVPALALVSYIKALITRELETSGVSFPAQEATSRAILNAIGAGRMAGAPMAPFAPPIPSFPAPPLEPAAEPFDIVPVRRRQPIPSSATTTETFETIPLMPVGRPAMPARPGLSDLIRSRTEEMGITAADVERRAQQFEAEQFAARRGESEPAGLTQIDSLEQFQSLGWQKIRKWFDDWAPLIPEMRTSAAEYGVVVTRGQDAGKLKYNPPNNRVSAGKSALTTAFEIYLERRGEVGLKGRGMNRRPLAPSSRFPTGRAILGYGLSRKNVAVDMTRGIQNTMPTYVPFGRYIINPSKLSRGVLEVKTLNGGKLNKYPTKEISPTLTKIMKRILDDRMPDEYDFKEMDLEDQNYLFDLAKDAKINERLNIPTPKLSKDGEEMNRFEILKGQIIAGNDNREMVKEFKTMLLKLSNEGRVKKAEAREILMDLTAMGY
jgi:hypothetical protein